MGLPFLLGPAELESLGLDGLVLGVEGVEGLGDLGLVLGALVVDVAALLEHLVEDEHGVVEVLDGLVDARGEPIRAGNDLEGDGFGVGGQRHRVVLDDLVEHHAFGHAQRLQMR